MYLYLIPKIKEILESVEVADGKKLTVYPYPMGEGEYPDVYPAAVFFPDDYSNEFASNETNFKQIKFKLTVMINAENITNEEVFTFTLPSITDKIISEIDENWNVGTLNGKRVWLRTDVGFWSMDLSSGRIAFVEMDLLTKFETNN